MTDLCLKKNFWSSSSIKKCKESECFQVKIKNIKPTLLMIDIEGGKKDLMLIN